MSRKTWLSNPFRARLSPRSAISRRGTQEPESGALFAEHQEPSVLAGKPKGLREGALDMMLVPVREDLRVVRGDAYPSRRAGIDVVVRHQSALAAERLE
jgi:hypothetical protein